MQKWTVRNTLDALAAKSTNFARLLEKQTFDVSLYKLEGIDRQTPHQRDEMYIVASGSGAFVCDGEKEAVGPGDALFVAAGVAHHFEDFTADFSTWVIFFGPRPGDGAD
jgi:mannose-6-phosphate isomerase-like protein (cupin superfamily)